MTGLTLKFWPVATIIVIIAGLLLSLKGKTKTTKIVILSVFVVFGIVIAISGIKYNKGEESAQSDSQSEEQTVEQSDSENSIEAEQVTNDEEQTVGEADTTENYDFSDTSITVLGGYNVLDSYISYPDQMDTDVILERLKNSGFSDIDLISHNYSTESGTTTDITYYNAKYISSDNKISVLCSGGLTWYDFHDGGGYSCWNSGIFDAICEFNDCNDFKLDCDNGIEALYLFGIDPYGISDFEGSFSINDVDLLLPIPYGYEGEGNGATVTFNIMAEGTEYSQTFSIKSIELLNFDDQWMLDFDINIDEYGNSSLVRYMIYQNNDYDSIAGHYKGESTSIEVWPFESPDPLSVGYLYVVNMSIASEPSEIEFWYEDGNVYGFYDDGKLGHPNDVMYIEFTEDGLTLMDYNKNIIEWYTRTE